MQNTIVKFSLVIFAALTLLAACSKNEARKSLSELIPNPPAKTAAAPPKEEKANPPKYVYPYSVKRDPFTPLLGVSGGGLAAGNGAPGAKGARSGNLASLELKGILRDKKGKMAIISSTDGESYTLKSGRIYDKKNQMVKGVTGIIKLRSVVLISNNKTVRELRLVQQTD